MARKPKDKKPLKLPPEVETGQPHTLDDPPNSGGTPPPHPVPPGVGGPGGGG